MPDDVKTIPVQKTPVTVADTGPKTPPAEVAKTTFKDDFTSTMDDFKVEQLPVKETKEKTLEKVLDTDPTGKPKTEVVKEEEAVEPGVEKSEEKKVESTVSKYLKPPAGTKEEVKEGEKKEIIKKIAPSTDKVVRDYSGYSQEEVAALKQMSNPAFQLATKLIQENRELAKLKGSTYLQHDNAYVLDPDFQAARNDYSFAQREAEYWQEQLIAMDAGKEWQPITGWDQQGNPILDKPRPPTKRDEEKVRLALNSCVQAANEFKGKLQNYPTQYKQRVQQDLQNIQQERANRFGWVSDPKLLDYTINVEGLGPRSVKQIRQDFIGLFPAYLQSHPAMEVAADLMVAFRMQSAELSDLRNGKQIEDIKNGEEERIEPTSQVKPPREKTPVHGVKEFKDLPELY
jgi:hypothetical protein